MRMWMVSPNLLCDKHLLGEHSECHMFVGTLLKGKSIKGYLDKGLVEVHNLRSRHDSLAEEMISRGMNHQSPLPKFQETAQGIVSVIQNLYELMSRCAKCRKKIHKTLCGGVRNHNTAGSTVESSACRT